MAAGLLAACATPDQQPEVLSADAPHIEVAELDADLVADGRDIAEGNCAVCHAIGLAGDSPRAEAPPLRQVAANFDLEALATDFREHIKVGSEIMPEFNFSPLHTDALMAYLEALNRDSVNVAEP